MALPLAAKATFAIATDPKLRKAAVGIILGAVIIVIVPIAFLLTLGETTHQIDWNSPEIRSQIKANITSEQREKIALFNEIMAVIEVELTAGEKNTDTIFTDIESAYNVEISAEEREQILKLIETKENSQ